jgi:thiol-disulfide isomerase/thioredoxin
MADRRTLLQTTLWAFLLSSCGLIPQPGTSSSASELESLVDAKTLPDGPPAPDFVGGGAWLNTEPLTLTGLRGKVVLVDFWTYGCINCRNTLPAMRSWWDSYRDKGLVIVGVHTPEFAHEHELENVRAAIESEQIGWPVVQDNNYQIWRAYGNRYWPHFYLIDHRGLIIYDHIGEGAYDRTEQKIAEALGNAG